MVQWAAEDWRGKSRSRGPRYVHMGENSPFPNAPKKACEAYAQELGFEVLSAIVFSQLPDDFTPQCQQLDESGANYAFLANTGTSVAALLKACHAIGVDVQFIANMYGYSEVVMKEAGEAADGVVYVMSAAKWGDEVPGMYTVREIARMSDPRGEKYHDSQYTFSVCAMFFLKEAMEWADAHGGITGPNIRRAMYQRKDWVPAGLEGVCSPATWTEDDHRGINRVLIYRGRVAGETEGDIEELVETGVIRMEKIFAVDVPRKPEWLGQ